MSSQQRNVALRDPEMERIERLLTKRPDLVTNVGVVRQALSWYEECVDHRDAGGAVLFENNDGVRSKVSIRV